MFNENEGNSNDNNGHGVEGEDFIKRVDIQRNIGSRALRNDGYRLNIALKRLEENSRISVRREKNLNGRISEYIYLQL